MLVVLCHTHYVPVQKIHTAASFTCMLTVRGHCADAGERIDLAVLQASPSSKEDTNLFKSSFLPDPVLNRSVCLQTPNTFFTGCCLPPGVNEVIFFPAVLFRCLPQEFSPQTLSHGPLGVDKQVSLQVGVQTRSPRLPPWGVRDQGQLVKDPPAEIVSHHREPVI